MNTARLQFSLSSFLWFVLAAAAFAAQLAFRFDSDWGRDWRTPATVIVAWVVLGHFYLAKDLREPDSEFVISARLQRPICCRPLKAWGSLRSLR